MVLVKKNMVLFNGSERGRSNKTFKLKKQLQKCDSQNKNTQNKATFSSDVLSITLGTRDKDQSWIEQLRSALCESFTEDNRIPTVSFRGRR